MSSAELLGVLTRRGVKLTVSGDRLRYEAPPGALTPELFQAMRGHKAALMELLEWPPESWESEAVYHHPPVLVTPHARLFPLVGRKVQTPHGVGTLLQVFATQATVALDGDPEQAVVFAPDQIRPLSQDGRNELS